MTRPKRPFDIAYRSRLIPSPDGYQEEVIGATITFYEPILDQWQDKEQGVDPFELKILITLALHARPLDGRDFAELSREGIVTEEDRGKLAAVISNPELARAAGLNRKTVENRCLKLAERGWLALHDLGQSRFAGRFNGRNQFYILKASKKIIHTPEPPTVAPQVSGTRGGGQENVSVDTTAGTGYPQDGHGIPRASVPGTRGEASMVMESMGTMEEQQRGGTSTEVVVATPNSEELKDTPSTPTQQATALADMKTILYHFLDQANKQCQPLEEPGQSRTNEPKEQYEIALALLSQEVTPGTVTQAPAKVIEDLLLLSQTLWRVGLDTLLGAIDRATLEQSEPCRSLAYIWPLLPEAQEFRQHLRQVLKSGRQLPEGKFFRNASKLFICLNRFQVGPKLLTDFLTLCQSHSIPEVQAELVQALKSGRDFVTLRFIQKGISLRKRAQQEREPEPDQGTLPQEEKDEFPPPEAEEEMDCLEGPNQEQKHALQLVEREADDTDLWHERRRPAFAPTPRWKGKIPEVELVRVWLEDYGVMEPILSRWCGKVHYATVRGWILYLETQEKMNYELRRSTLIARIRENADPPGYWRRTAAELPPLSPTDEYILENDFQHRYYHEQWSDSEMIDLIGQELAERWFEIRQRYKYGQLG